MRCRPLVHIATLALVLAAAPAALAGSYLRVQSWNLRHEGWSGETYYTGDAQQIWFQFGSSATSPNGCDLVFLQEVMNQDVPKQLAAALTSISGYPWSYAVTAPIGRTTYKECYAVLYRTDRVSLVSATVWADAGDKFEREPMIVKVRDRATTADFTFINWHTVFGTTAQRQAELATIPTVFATVQAQDATDQDVILLGDHNADATSSWWSTFTSTAVVNPQVSVRVNEKTSLNSAGAYASAYDHFWFQGAYVTEYSSSGRDYVADTTSFYAVMSDHAPVWMKLYSSADGD